MKTRRRKAADRSNTSPSTSATSVIRSETVDDDVNKDAKVETKRHVIKDDDDGSSSDSSIGDYLKSTDKIDLNSSFFKIDAKKSTDFQTIEKKILANVDTLSDSEESVSDAGETCDGDEPVRNVDTDAPETTVPDEIMRFEQLEEYTKKLEDVKSKLENFSSNLPKEQLDIRQLLAAGETVNEEISCDISGSEDDDASESEMEEVEEKPSPYQAIPKEGVQITLNVPIADRQKKKNTDIMMVIKRKINRVKKECQVYVHKVHLLCWVAHGNFLNSVINDPVLLGMALSLIPSQHCYPKERTDLGYLEQITKWYVKLIKVKDKGQDEKSYEEPLIQSLKTQINKKEAYSKRDLVLIFVCMMRSLGIQCRLMVSFRVLPLRPPSSELCSLSTKTDKGSTSENKDGESSKAPAKKDPVKKPSASLKNDQKSTEKKTGVRETKSDSNKIPSKKNDTDVKTGGSKCISSKNVQKNTKTAQKRAKKPTDADSKIPQVGGSIDSLKNPTDIEVDNARSGTGQENSESASKRANNTKRTSLTLKKIPQVDGANDLPKEKSIKAAKSKPKAQKSDSVQPADGKSVRGDSKRRKVQEVNSGKDLSDEKKIETAELDLKSQKSDPAGGENNVRSRMPRNKKPVKYAELESDEDFRPSSVKKMKTKPNVKSVLVSPDETTSSFFKNAHGSPVKETQRAIRKALRLPDLESVRTDNVATKNDARAAAQGEKTSSFFAKNRPNLKTAIVKMKNVSNTANDIMRLMKQRIAEQKQIDRTKRAKKNAKAYDEDEDSDYAPEPVVKKKRPSNGDNSDDDFDMNHKRKMKSAARKSKENDRRVLSTDEDNDEQPGKRSTKIGNDFWVEVFLEAEEKWIPVDVIKGRVHCVSEIFSRATQPVTYIVAWNNNNTLKDVTSRYCKNWNTVTRKLRVDKDWWNQTLKPYIGKKTARDKEEDEDLARQQLEQPLPTTISEYKNHPLYALQRHLLKFEAIYPPDAITLGFVRNEPVYARECVYTLHSRETWVKQARVVKPGEKPYKIVKARPKYDKLSGNVITDIPLEVFGPWQTQDYVPPVAENGVVPRNAYGNVELFKPCMLPKGTVHLQLPGLNKVARKLGIDCASAMIGFDYHSGGSHPAFDGFVVCEEFKETLIAAWQQEQEEAEKRAQEKIENRVYGNWKKLIKGLLIRERLKAKYGFGEPSSSEATTKKKKSKGPRFQTKKK